MSYLLRVGKECNNNCILCGELGFKAKTDKTLDKIKEEIDSVSDEILVLPCNADIRKDFIEILKYVKDKGKKVLLHTNGRVFYYCSFCKEVSGHLDKVILHLYGNNPKTHDRRTKVNRSFLQAKQGQANFSGMKTMLWATEYTKKRPSEVVIEITSMCNFNCITCFNKASFAGKDRGRELSVAFVKDVIDSVADAGIPRVRFSGGEPLLHKGLFELMAYAKSKGLTVWLNTNATLVDENNVKELEKYVENVLVPMNGFDSNSDNLWTQTDGSFEDKLRGLKLLKKSSIPIVRAGTVATPDNIDNLEKIYAVVKELGLTHWEVYRPVSVKEDDSDFNIQKLITKLAKLSLDFGRVIPIANAYPFCLIDKDVADIFSLGAYADDGHSRIIIDPRGFAKPSYFIDEDVGDPRDIKNCWSNKFMKDMREFAFVPKTCQSCSVLETCRAGSRYAAKLFFGSYKELDPLFQK